MTHEEFAEKHPHPPSPIYVKIDRHFDPVIHRHHETAIDRQPPAPVDRRAPITYRVQMPKIDVARIIAACHCGAEYETEYSASIETHTATSIDSAQQKSTDGAGLQVEPSKELFTFLDCSQRNSGGIVRDLEVQIGNALVPVDFHVLDIKLNWNSSLLLGRAFLSTVGAVCNLQTNRLCLTLIDPHVHYNPIPVKKPQTTPRRINDPGIIAACHCGADAQQKSTDGVEDESVDSDQGEWGNDYYNPTMAAHNMHTEEYDEDYEEERAIEQRATLDEEYRLLHHSFWKKKSPSIDRNGSPSIVGTKIHTVDFNE
ncbi:hypothetical protein DY000_02053509 [Brassica cretica]|uniref:Uncharacterized protein n=1 Tax=Brassica cretica TaxID=69181 RepID=A0ABQ7AM04_BRACR|nr:hypothetical protein DY000_02053509 [Brassica cretica]